jgi:hypothetical protein
MNTPATPEAAAALDYYTPGAMTEELRAELVEHLQEVGAWKQTIPPPSDPVIRAMTAGPRARTVGVRAASEAILFLAHRAAPDTDAFEMIRDLRQLHIAASWGQVACDNLFKHGQLVIDDQHRYVLPPDTEG